MTEHFITVSYELKDSCSLFKTFAKVLLSGWKQLFPAKFKTELESLTFTKKLMTATISNILFVRNIFGDDAFAKKSLDGIPLRILKEKSSDLKAKSLANWLMGAFDALKNKYLRTLTLVIFLDPAFPEDTHEAYTIKVTYPGGLPSCEVVGTLAHVQNSTRDLLRAILMLTEGLEPLPETAYIALRLSYYDENTPQDYEPKGFQSAEKELILPATSTRVKIGRVSTAHHSLSFNVHAKPGGSSQEDQFLNDQFQQSQLSQSQSQLVQGENVQQVNTRSGRSVEEMEQLEHIAEEREVDEELPEEGGREDQSEVEVITTICCTCGSQKCDEQMLLCQYCGNQQHLPCYKLLPGDPLPSAHCCLPCSLQGEGRICTDAKLGRIATKKGANASVVANTMVFRRVLAALDLCNIVSEETLSELGLMDEMVISIAKKLLQDGIVQEGGQVDRSVLEDVRQRHFGRRASKRSREEEEVETMLRATDGLQIGDRGEVAGPSGDNSGDIGGLSGAPADTGARHGEENETQLGGGGNGGGQQEQGRERKRRRVSRTRGE